MYILYSDFGYKRDIEGNCVEDHEGRSHRTDICIDDQDELITTQVC